MSLESFHNQVVSVETKAAAILGTSVSGRVEGTYVSYGVASSFKDVAAVHAQVMPHLDPADRVELTDDSFILLRKDDKVEPYAISWLNLSTAVIVADTKIQVMISGDMNQSRLRQLLLANGYTVHSMGTVGG